MFFRKERPKNPTFDERMENLRKAGFAVAPLAGGASRVSRGEYVIELKERDGSVFTGGRAGILLCDEIATLVDGGFQKFFRTATGKQSPAVAEQLEGLHDFEEDLKEALGQQSYYNESLGTVSTYYLYDRVQGRDEGRTKRIWD